MKLTRNGNTNNPVGTEDQTWDLFMWSDLGYRTQKNRLILLRRLIIQWQIIYLTESISPLNVSGLFIAKSANTLRSSSIPFSLNL